MERSRIQKIFYFLLGVMLLFTGAGHLTWGRTEFLAQVPPWVPMDKDLVVVLSGVAEILLGGSVLLLQKYSAQIGWVIALFFVAVFPGNISQFTHHINGFGLDSDVARGVRLFFQPVLVAWALWASGAWKYKMRIG